MSKNEEPVRQFCFPPSVVALHFPPEANMTADKVRRWIRSGRLTAMNFGSARHPRYFISQDVLQKFIETASK